MGEMVVVVEVAVATLLVGLAVTALQSFASTFKELTWDFTL